MGPRLFNRHNADFKKTATSFEVAVLISGIRRFDFRCGLLAI